MKISAFDARVGNLLEYRGKLWRVLRKNHVKPGKGGAFVQLEMKCISDQTKLNERFRSEDKIERAQVEARRMQYLYAEGESHVFMDAENYEQIQLAAGDFEAQARFLSPGADVQINFHNGQPIGMELPAAVALDVVETEGATKGQTMSGAGKPATLETGLKVSVPLFIEVGDKVRVNTESGEYIERA
ncbi:MAG: elongation factor P [Gammaproteobacteria bacterium]|nr:elongation factor P [Gammaproteobacteria bacterium]CAJ2376544.1 MAG: Elongation factor P [Arenicellales bacterium IbO2]MDA7961035.1 elongation factor P [Gammaproteobacteria bacterium]MDA7967693.1 elongation factor P [Gammaproteobacteria bacterium]MDA7969950.1 elongation factor P [Gammaproteobacteria bacterium]